MARFDGRVALLSGVASGMGRCTAIRLASEGATVHGIDIDDEGAAATAADISGAGGTITVQRADLASVDECRSAVDTAVATHGRLDVLGNIAAISWHAHVADVTEEAWDTMMAINVRSMFFLCQAAIPHLLETDGTIVNIASNAGFMGQAYTVPYCASKGAVVNLTRALAMEFVKTPLRINAIAPGGTDTPMNRNFEVAENADVDLMRPYMGYRPFGRPEHIAALFAFLVSDEAANIHGSIINADSGLTAA